MNHAEDEFAADTDEEAMWMPEADDEAEGGIGPMIQPEPDLSRVTEIIAATFTGEFCVAR